VSGAPVNPIGFEPQPGSVRPCRHLFDASLTLVALVTMLAVGVVCAGVPRGLGKQGDGHASLTRNISVVVAAQEIPLGQRIFPDMVRTSVIRATDLPLHAFSKPSDVWLSRAAVPIKQNEIITNDLLAVACQGYCPLPSDIVALTLPIDVLGPARFIVAGDYVNVIATVNTAVFSPKHPRWVSQTVFTSVVVTRIAPPRTNRVGPDSMTIAASLCDAQYIYWFAVNASLRYTVASADYSAELASAESRCAGPIGPAQVDARWGFSTASPSRPR
jgi:hypothetical protein